MGIAAARSGSRDCISITNGTQQSYLLDDTHPLSAIPFGGPSRVPSAPLHNMIRLENLSKEYEATSHRRILVSSRPTELNLESSFRRNLRPCRSEWRWQDHHFKNDLWPFGAHRGEKFS